MRNKRVPGAATGAIGANQVPRAVRRVWTIITLAALGLVLVSGSAWLWHKRSAELAASASSRTRSLVVLPLENLSGSPEQDYLADGKTEALESVVKFGGGDRSATTSGRMKGNMST